MEEVLIIGGGFAGLAAGVALTGVGQRVRLVEQKPHLGGRAFSFRDATTGATVDNGQHLLMGCYRATIRFLETIGTLDRVRFQPQFTVNFLDRPGRVTTLKCPNHRAPWHLLAGVLRSCSFGVREKLEIVRLGRALGSRKPTPGSLDRLSVEEWLTCLGQSEKLRRNFWDLLCIAAMNEDPRRASAALFERVLRLALFRSPEDARLGVPAAGLSECYTEAATRYITARGGQVETGRRVLNLIVSSEAGRGGLGLPTGARSARLPACEGARFADGSEVRARAVLSAVPWLELARLLPEEVLRSEPFFAACLALRPAPIISINLWFDRPITDLEFAGLRGTTIQWLFNKSPVPSDSRRGSPESGLVRVSLVLSGAHAHIERSKDDLLAVALRELAELVPAAGEAKLVHSLVLKERLATFSPGCDTEALRPPTRTPMRGLYLAGDWTATGLPATIEGAVQSGYTAAQEIERDNQGGRRFVQT